jgi:hypothetical protein
VLTGSGSVFLWITFIVGGTMTLLADLVVPGVSQIVLGVGGLMLHVTASSSITDDQYTFQVGPVRLNQRLPNGVTFTEIRPAPYRGAPQSSIGYLPPPGTQPAHLQRQPVLLRGSGWLGPERRALWLQALNGSRVERLPPTS